MLGPLPYLHRLLLVVAALAVGTGIGAWLGLLPAFPLPLSIGTLIGLAAGAGAALLLIHDFHPSSTAVTSRHHVL